MRILPLKRLNYQRFEVKASNLIQKAVRRAESASEMVDRLESLTVSGRGLYNTRRLSLCGAPENIYLASEMNNCGTGELFDGVGNLYSCNLPYCPNCRVQKSRSHKKRIRQGLEGIKILVGQRWRFVTLTAPSVPNRSLLESLAVVNRAWGLFRKRKVFVESVAGYFKNLEFTVNVKSRVPHVHLHGLFLSKFLRRDDVRRVWTDCILRAWSERGVTLKIKTSDNLCLVDIREIRAKENHSSLEAAILECGKYAAKGADWMRLSDRDLSDIASLDRFPRMFEAGGNLSNRNISPSLDKQYLSDGEKKQQTEFGSKALNYADLICCLTLKARVVRQFRKAQLVGQHPVAVFKTLAGDVFSSSRDSESRRIRLICREIDRAFADVA